MSSLLEQERERERGRKKGEQREKDPRIAGGKANPRLKGSIANVQVVLIKVSGRTVLFEENA